MRKLFLFLKKNKFLYIINNIVKKICSNLYVDYKKTYFIAVPRSGTTLIGKLLKEFNQKIEWSNHFFKPKFFNKLNYIVSIRDPSSRFISAFYHSKFNQQNSYYKNFFSTYPEVGNLIDDLGSIKAKSHINLTTVLNESLSTFFTIDYLKKNPPLYIFNYSTIYNDIKKFFYKENRNNSKKFIKILKKNYGKTSKKKISKKRLIKLKNYLKKDYIIYDYLLKLKKNYNSKLFFLNLSK